MDDHDMKIRSARSDEINEIRQLLAGCALPAEDISESASITFLVAAKDGRPISGCVGLEARGAVGLLRSLAVTADTREIGIGRALVAAAEVTARLRQIEELYLLTTTASQFFIRRGYGVVERSSAPEELQKSTQFADFGDGDQSFRRT
ncbi:GNAT family N-acetyltransferase [Burkholderia multivorans]|uniref:GNAT family N-acetyltransferase n=1 Tax=Burkholderia multivorans TaxID=87883 RepID=UPI000D0020BE|nr:GNAT family N-acetyltransferase [Burkholderia multivorans]PRF46376.1 GNAT family N-acetyltransferase [Burkholderia multivorans]